MGRSAMVTHVLYYTDQGGEHWVAWPRSHGKPSPENIERWIDSFVASQYPGNINEDIAKAHNVLVVPHEGRIYRQLGGGQKQLEAQWKAPSFWVLPEFRKITVDHPDVRQSIRPVRRSRSQRPRLTK